MLIESITGATKKNNIRVEENCSALIITKDEAFTTEKIAARINRRGKEDLNVCVNLEVIKLGEIAAMTEGFMLKFKTGGKEAVVIPIAGEAGGGIALDKEQSLIADLNDLDNAQDYEVFVVGGGYITDVVRKYERDVVLTGKTSRNVSLRGVERAFVDNNTDITDVKVNFTSHSNTHTLEELQYMNNIMNDLVSATQTLTDSAAASGDLAKFGFVDLLQVPYTIAALSMDIKTDATGQVEYFVEKIVEVSSFIEA